MRRARITYEGALHHAMNRGINGEHIFVDNECKEHFLHLLKELSQKHKLQLLAFCIMDSHYHLILINSNNKMSDFMKDLNGQYGMFYRTRFGGKGYVFQGRFVSTLIQDEHYLKTSIAYALRNPVKAGLVSRADEYMWSSISEYFSNKKSQLIDVPFVEELFEQKVTLLLYIENLNDDKLPVIYTRYGDILGLPNFVEQAAEKFDRRTIGYSERRKRIDDQSFEPVEKVFMEFEKKHKIKIDDIDIKTYQGKRLRGKLLIKLKDYAGLKYSEISEISIFLSVKQNSLGSLYKKAKEKEKSVKKRRV